MKKFSMLLLILLIINSVYAQKKYLEINKNYSVAKIYQKDMYSFKVLNLTLTNDTVLQYNLSDSEGSSKRTQISTDNIRYIQIKNGTHAGSYGIYGGVTGLLSAIYGVLSVKADPNLDDSGVDWAPFIFGFTAGGFAIGALVGLCVPKWKLLYIPDKKTSYSIGLSPNVNQYYYGLSLKVSF
jgi:hypothetical protein